MKVLGLDVGEKRIGVAKADSNTRIAVPVGYLLNDASLWPEIARLTRLHGTSFFVLGLPRSNEGNETKQSLFVRQFAKTLVEKVPEAKIRFQDESLTSVVAEERLKKRKKKYERGDIDAEAASIILQDFIENYKEGEIKKIDEKNIIKRETDKAKLQGKKISKWKIFGIPGVVIVLLLGITGALKIRDKIRADREEEYRRQEAEMVAEVFDFTILPGETIFDVKEKLLGVGYSETEVTEALTYDYDFDFLNEPRAAATSRGDKSLYLEGYLFGETHEFYREDSAVEVIAKFLEGTGEVFRENALAEKYARQGLGLCEGVTLASIVQKEAPTPEMPTVAQVFLTRLEYGIALGSDVTVSYALDTLGVGRGGFADNTEALKVDSCYNTRLYAGLPCGPISNPGLNALLSIAEPDDTDYLFFLTGDDGLMYYSYTQAEHDYNAYIHCRELCGVAL